MLDVAYNLDERPEAQQGLRAIPPSNRVDEPHIHAALVAFEQALKVEHTRRLDFHQAEIELDAARFRDQQALADALAKNAKDPGNKHERDHVALIDECRRQWGASKLLLATAVENVVQAFAEHGAAWQQDLDDQRDGLRDQMAGTLDRYAELWQALQLATANLALLRDHGGSQSPSLYAASFRVPMVRDGSVIQVADVLEGLRGLAAPEKPNESAVENQAVGAEPSRHNPPRKSPFAGGSAQALGRVRDPELVQQWVEKDEAEARQRGLSDEQRQERLARAGARKAEREAVREASRQAIEATS